MTILFLVRHGETDWNRERRIQGSTDIPLNATGRAQAQDAAAALRESIDARFTPVVASSDLSRARETAEIIALDFGAAAPHVYPDLRERGYGEAEGIDADVFTARWGASRSDEIPGSEPWADVRVRALRGLRRVVADARAATAQDPVPVIAVAHGGLIREIIRYASGGALPLAGQHLANGSVTPLMVERDRIRLLDPARA